MRSTQVVVETFNEFKKGILVKYKKIQNDNTWGKICKRIIECTSYIYIYIYFLKLTYHCIYVVEYREYINQSFIISLKENKKSILLTKRNSSSLYPNCTAKTFSWLRFFNLLFRSHVWTKGIGYDVSSDVLRRGRIAFSFFFFFFRCFITFCSTLSIHCIRNRRRRIVILWQVRKCSWNPK